MDDLTGFIQKITKVLSKFSIIEFAYIFGSYAKNKTRFNSDVDIAIYFREDPDLLNIGDIASKLEEAVSIRIDLVSLNELYSTNPRLAYNIISDGKLILSNNSGLHTLYKKKVFLYYFDHLPMLKKFDELFINRLKENRFGKYD